MDKMLQLTNAELTELHELLARECMSTRDELHHTDSREFRAEVKDHLDLVESVLRKVEVLRGMAVAS